MRVLPRSTIAGLVGTLLALTAQAASGPNPTAPRATAEVSVKSALSLRLAPASSSVSSLLEGLAALLTGSLLLIGASRISRDDATH